MNVNGSSASERADPREPRDASIPCAGRVFVGIDGRRPGRPVDPVDSQETATLLRAFNRGNAGLAKAEEAFAEPVGKVHQLGSAARSAVEAVERFAARRTTDEATEGRSRVRVRHGADGPESLRRSRRPWSWLQWVVLVLSALFDLPFIGDATGQVLSLDPARPSYYLAYLAAAGAPVLQFAAGSWLARSLLRLRVRSGRGAERILRSPGATVKHWLRLDGFRAETRRPDDLPWADTFWPIMANLTLMLLLALTAYARVQTSNTSNFGPMGGVTAVFVVLSLSAATVVAKILAHNPYTESSKAADKAVKGAEKSTDELVREARKRLSALTAPWHDQYRALHRARSDAERVVDEACAQILDERADSERAGTLELPLREYAWPTVEEQEPGPATPRLRTKRLRHWKELLDDCAPAPLERRLADAVEDLLTQSQQPKPEKPLP